MKIFKISNLINLFYKTATNTEEDLQKFIADFESNVPKSKTIALIKAGFFDDKGVLTFNIEKVLQNKDQIKNLIESASTDDFLEFKKTFDSIHSKSFQSLQIEEDIKELIIKLEFDKYVGNFKRKILRSIFGNIRGIYPSLEQLQANPTQQASPELRYDQLDQLLIVLEGFENLLTNDSAKDWKDNLEKIKNLINKIKSDDDNAAEDVMDKIKRTLTPELDVNVKKNNLIDLLNGIGYLSDNLFNRIRAYLISEGVTWSSIEFFSEIFDELPQNRATSLIKDLAEVLENFKKIANDDSKVSDHNKQRLVSILNNYKKEDSLYGLINPRLSSPPPSSKSEEKTTRKQQKATSIPTQNPPPKQEPKGDSAVRAEIFTPLTEEQIQILNLEEVYKKLIKNINDPNKFQKLKTLEEKVLEKLTPQSTRPSQDTVKKVLLAIEGIISSAKANDGGVKSKIDDVVSLEGNRFTFSPTFNSIISQLTGQKSPVKKESNPLRDNLLHFLNGEDFEDQDAKSAKPERAAAKSKSEPFDNRIEEAFNLLKLIYDGSYKQDQKEARLRLSAFGDAAIIIPALEKFKKTTEYNFEDLLKKICEIQYFSTNIPLPKNLSTKEAAIAFIQIWNNPSFANQLLIKQSLIKKLIKNNSNQLDNIIKELNSIKAVNNNPKLISAIDEVIKEIQKNKNK